MKEMNKNTLYVESGTQKTSVLSNYIFDLQDSGYGTWNDLDLLQEICGKYEKYEEICQKYKGVWGKYEGICGKYGDIIC